MNNITTAQKQNDLAMQGFTVLLPGEDCRGYRLLFREWDGLPRELGSTDYDGAISEAWDSLNRILNERLMVDKSPRSSKCISNE